MDITSKRVIMIIAPENFRDEEYFHTREAIEKKGANVEVASLAKKAVSGIDNVEVETDRLVSEIDDSYDAIVFVGGGGAKVYFDNEDALALARSYWESGKVIAAICIAPVILGHAGILNDKKATCWDGAHGDLTGFGAEFTGEPVTVDGKLVTGNGPKSAYEFGEAVADAL